MLLLSVREGEQGESEGRRVVRYPDSQQLFVGNVPHDVDKNELKEFFESMFDPAAFVKMSACMRLTPPPPPSRLWYRPGAADQQRWETAQLWVCGV